MRRICGAFAAHLKLRSLDGRSRKFGAAKRRHDGRSRDPSSEPKKSDVGSIFDNGRRSLQRMRCSAAQKMTAVAEVGAAISV